MPNPNEYLLAVYCPHCLVKAGVPCRNPDGSLRDPPHARRIKAAEVRQTLIGEPMESVVVDGLDHPPQDMTSYEEVTTIKIRLPRKLRHRVRAHSYVWCDHHGSVHEAVKDFFDEGVRWCAPEAWRRVYIESDDKSETF